MPNLLTRDDFRNGVFARDKHTCAACKSAPAQDAHHIMKSIFLGGTCNNSTWRDQLIPLLTRPYFNPVVKDWTPECQAQEIKERDSAEIVLYTITPKMTGVYSIAEVVDDSHKHPSRTVLCIISQDEDQTFTPHQAKSLTQVAKMVEGNGGQSIIINDFGKLHLLANLLNNLDAKAKFKGWTFHINAEQALKIQEWTEKRSRYCGAIGGQFSYIFGSTSLGEIVKVRDDLSGQELDVTDYESW